MVIKPDRSIKYFAFGYHENVVDGLWLRVIQDYDLCEQGRWKEAGIERFDQPISGKNRIANCKLGWVYHMLDVITELAPRFREPALTGPVVLSVLVDDIEGATKIFDKVVVNFPEDWEILYRAAYHYLWEVEDNTRAAELMIEAGRNGAPKWVYSLAARLYTEEGKAMVAKTVLERVLSEMDIDEGYVRRIRQRLNAVNLDLDLGQKKSQKTGK